MEKLKVKYEAAVSAYPKDVFRASRNVGFANEQEVSMLLEMVDDRNLTSHTYLEPLAQRISAKIPDYYCIMKKLLDQAH